MQVCASGPSGHSAARFNKVFTNDSQGGSFYLQSNDVELGAPYEAAKHLTSEALRNLSQNYVAGSGEYLPKADATKFVTYSFYSYIGQVVNVNWPLQAVPADPYKFTTYGALESAGNYYFNISPSTVWYNPDEITRANTELDLIMNGNIQVVTGTSGEGGISPANLKSKGLVPVFELTDTPDKLMLSVPSGAAEGAYTIVVEAHSSWKDYTYTLTIRNGNVTGGIDAGNQDYGNGGSQTWK